MNNVCAKNHWGVYTLANDRVIEWFLAFIKSFRKTNPDLHLTVIPYNSSIGQIRSLSEQFHFEIMDETKCKEFDKIESIVMEQGKSAGMFRKWACFFGEYDEFLFVDSDVVFPISVTRLLEGFSDARCDFCYFDILIDDVYSRQGIKEMVPKYGAIGFNAGAFISRKNLINKIELFELSECAKRDQSYFNIIQVDQPFLNYVIDVKKFVKRNISDIIPEIAPSATVRQCIVCDFDNDIYKDRNNRLLPFIHWPGCAFPTMMRSNIFLHYRLLDCNFLQEISYKSSFYWKLFRIRTRDKFHHFKKIIYQFLFYKNWRRFYLLKLVGIRSNVP